MPENFDDITLLALAESVGEQLRQKDLMLVAAESCTGGWLAKVATDVVGSSSWFERGFVTYTNDAKHELLGVEIQTLDNFGAVSEPVVKEMVAGALSNSHAQIAVAISGIAGPGGGSAEKPVGTVCFAWAKVHSPDSVMPLSNLVTETCYFSGDREAIRRQAVAYSLKGVMAIIHG
ncbi:MAG: nicotinamide-nucleotide amidase [Gammaproteobacteria bacterium]|nr:nicotinamide-nucleotide amidase [Gammaproteobacteria bacterium]